MKTIPNHKIWVVKQSSSWVSFRPMVVDMNLDWHMSNISWNDLQCYTKKNCSDSCIGLLNFPFSYLIPSAAAITNWMKIAGKWQLSECVFKFFWVLGSFFRWTKKAKLTEISGEGQFSERWFFPSCNFKCEWKMYFIAGMFFSIYSSLNFLVCVIL